MVLQGTRFPIVRFAGQNQNSTPLARQLTQEIVKTYPALAGFTCGLGGMRRGHAIVQIVGIVPQTDKRNSGMYTLRL